MRLLLILLNAAVLLVFVARFMQPQFLYWARRLVVDVRLGKFLLDRARKRRVNQRDYVKLQVQDLRPEGVTSMREILPRVNKVRELYSILDLRREAVRDLPEARNSQICVVELANLLSAVAQHLRPNENLNEPSIKANDLLFMIAQCRNAQGQGGIGTLPEPGNEDGLEAYLRRYPLTLEQFNEIAIAAIYAAMYRLVLGNAVRFRSSAFNSTEPKPYFKKPAFFGDDLGSWLRQRLERLKYSVTAPRQDKRGWYVNCAKGEEAYALSIAYLPEPDAVWQIVLRPRKPLPGRLLVRSNACESALSRDLYNIFADAPEIERSEWLFL